MAKIKNLSHWGQEKARERYQVGGPIAGGFVPPQALARPALPAQAMGRPAIPTRLPLAARPAMSVQAMGRRPFKSGGKVKHKQVGGPTDSDSVDINVSPFSSPEQQQLAGSGLGQIGRSIPPGEPPEETLRRSRIAPTGRVYTDQYGKIHGLRRGGKAC